MREILFRAKRLCLGEWVEGYFLKAKMYRQDEELCEFISIPHPETEGMPSDEFLVDSDTVGQFTGLIDTNGKKIFEGDIVKAERICNRNSWTGCVAWWNGCFAIQGLKDENNVPAIDLFKDYEVIGNIHDNPELLEGKLDGK